MTSQSSETVAHGRFSARIERAIDRCWQRVTAPAEWEGTHDRFIDAIVAGIEQRFSQTAPDEGALEKHLDALYANDLALAVACRAANEAAWEFFVAKYRMDLYAAARAIVQGARTVGVTPEELADSLYADLYGLGDGATGRKALFEYFHGRSKLSTWLRAILAQRYVDEIRRTRRLRAIDDESSEDGLSSHAASAITDANSPSEPVDLDREKYLVSLQAELNAALEALAARDRLRLAYYYADGRTLAEIGRLLGEHEATVSRKLERTRRDVHQTVRLGLRDRKKLTEAQVEECLEYARKEWPFDLTGRLWSGEAKQDSRRGTF
jgi:RNA polymerase sigma-70 factor